MNVVAELLASSSYVIANKRLIMELGMQEAVLLGELCSEYNYWKRSGGLDGEWFYSTVENVERETGIKKTTQASMFGRLKRLGLLDVRKFGMPPCRHIRLDFGAIEELLERPDGSETEPPPPEIRAEVGSKSGRQNNNNKSNNKNNITLADVKAVCSKNGYYGMSPTPGEFAEWFYSAALTEDGGLEYKGRKVGTYAALVAVLKSIDLSGKRIKRERLKGGRYSPRADEGYL